MSQDFLSAGDYVQVVDNLLKGDLFEVLEVNGDQAVIAVGDELVNLSKVFITAVYRKIES